MKTLWLEMRTSDWMIELIMPEGSPEDWYASRASTPYARAA